MSRLGFGLTVVIGVLLSLTIQACSRPLPPQASCDFVQNPDQQRVSWNRRLPVKLYIHKSVPAEAYPALDRAVSEFNSKLGQEIFKVIARGTDGALSPQRDGYSTIYWFDSWEADKTVEQARTTIYWAGVEIYEADMRINGRNFTYNYSSSTRFSNVDLDSLFVHELGHAVGLAHREMEVSVMDPTLADGEVRREFTASDLANLRCEY